MAGGSLYFRRRGGGGNGNGVSGHVAKYCGCGVASGGLRGNGGCGWRRQWQQAAIAAAAHHGVAARQHVGSSGIMAGVTTLYRKKVINVA